jgi:proline iminopeptidase
VSFLIPKPDRTPQKQATSLAIIENHYFRHNGWLKPQQLIKNAYRLKGIPMTIVHGRYDMVCPIRSAWQLHQALPTSKLIIVPNAGHGMAEPKTFATLQKELRALE